VSVKYDVALLPCPFCGGTDLWAGVMSADSYGVSCRGCGAKMARGTPDKWPRGVFKKGDSDSQNFVRLHKRVLDQAVVAWNTRWVGQQEKAIAHVCD